MKLLNNYEIEAILKNLPGWMYVDNNLQKDYEFKDFAANLAVVNRIAAKSEEINHHPDLFIHSWNRLTVTLSTHSAGGVTALDFKLATIIEEITNDI